MSTDPEKTKHVRKQKLKPCNQNGGLELKLQNRVTKPRYAK